MYHGPKGIRKNFILSFFFLIYIDSLIKLLVSMCVLSPDVMKYKAVVVPFS